MSAIKKILLFSIYMFLFVNLSIAQTEIYGPKLCCKGTEAYYRPETCGICWLCTQIWSNSGTADVDYKSVPCKCTSGWSYLWINPGTYEIKVEYTGFITGIVYCTYKATVYVHDCIEGYNCEDNPVTVSTIVYDGKYSSMDLLTSDAIIDGKNVEFSSGTEIKLIPGFTAINSFFTAYTSECTKYNVPSNAEAIDKFTFDSSETPKVTDYCIEDSIYEITGVRPSGCTKVNNGITSLFHSNNLKKEILLHPNPTYGKIMIENYLVNKNNFIQLFDSYGRTLQTYYGKSEIDISTYPAGIYFIKAKTGKESKIFKIIKQ